MNLFTLVEEKKPDTWHPPELPCLDNVDEVSLDFETTGLNTRTDRPVGLAISYWANDLKSIYIPLRHSGGYNLDEEQVRRWGRRELFGKRVIFINAKYDVAISKTWGLDLEAACVEPIDVAFQGALLNDNRRAGLSLESLSQEYLGEGKAEYRGDKAGGESVPPWVMAGYGAQDARLTLLLYETLMPFIRKQNLEPVLALENDLIYPVCHIERNGCRLETEKLARWSAEIPREIRTLLEEVHRETGVWVNPSAPASIASAFKALRLVNNAVTDKGKPSYTDDILKRTENPTILKVLRARQLESVMSRFITPYLAALDHDHIYFGLNQLKSDDGGTVSGRFSSTGGSGYDFNVQQVYSVGNQKKELGDGWLIRELFIPEEGRDFFAVDAAQIEYRLFGHFARAPKILKAYRDNPDTDFHDLVMQMLLPIVPTIIRKHVKNVNFARLYGAQEEKISLMLGISLAETRKFLTAYDRIFPEAAQLMKRVSRDTRRIGHVSTLLGRRARFPDGQRIHSAVNRMIQGSAADLMKMKIRTLYRERKTLGISKMRQVVHDEQCGDMDPDPRFKKLMMECFNAQEVPLEVPILWEGKFGNNWADLKKCPLKSEQEAA